MILDWTENYSGWAYILWRCPGQMRLSAVKELRQIERYIKKTGMKGWIAESEFQYGPMHRILEKLGAHVYAKDQESFYFKKDLSMENENGKSS